MHFAMLHRPERAISGVSAAAAERGFDAQQETQDMAAWLDDLPTGDLSVAS